MLASKHGCGEPGRHVGDEGPCNSRMGAGRSHAIHAWGRGGAVQFMHAGRKGPCNSCMGAGEEPCNSCMGAGRSHAMHASMWADSAN